MTKASYILEDVDLAKLRAIMNRLYDDRPLNGDQRRDLANAMLAVLDIVQFYK